VYFHYNDKCTGHTQKNGAVSKVNSLLIPHHSFVYALYVYLDVIGTCDSLMRPLRVAT
jgi:hypothetical protein